MVTSSGVTVGRLRVHRGGGTDADPSRSAAMTFGMLDLRPASLPRGATLCVRHLRDPAPGTFPLGLRDTRAAAAWRTSVESALAELARQAARPADGPVPAAAVAVLFRDDVELLACLAADWSQPGGRSNWWWQRVARPALDGAVVRAWLSDIPVVPAVVDRLARRGELHRSLTAIDDSDVLTLVDALASTYGVSLPASWRAVSSISLGAASAPSPQPPAARGGKARIDEGRRRRPAAQLVNPWAALTRELIGLDRSRTLLAGMGLTLQRSPGLARSPAFTTAIGDWLRDERPAPEASATRTRSGDTQVGQPASRTERSREAAERPASSARQSRGQRFAVAAAPPSRPAVRRRRSGSTGEPIGPAPAPLPTAQPHEPALAIAESAAAPVASVGTIETRLGGVFFLLDVALYLGLYGDFSRPQEPGIGLDPWDFLTLLSGALGLRDELAADPLGELLRDLAGRPPGSRPGATWRPDADWRMPPEWLGPFAGIPGPWRWSGARRRLRIDHPAGFPVVDLVAAGRSTAARARRALPADSTSRALRRAALPTLPQAGHREIDRWIARLGVYAGARLRLALGLADAADLATPLLRLPARVTATVTEVDVEFELGQLPIEVRIAGLDRDPGWIPAARRTILFHFR